MVARSWKASFQAKFNVGFMEAGLAGEYPAGTVFEK
jgi:hypothetical protein